MTIFETIKDAVSITDAAERYGLQLNRRGKALCPFHHDTHPSMSFKNGGFVCFSCGARGDVLKLVGHLTGATKPIEAAQILNRDYGLGLNMGGKTDPTAARKYAQERERLQAFRRWEQHACNVWATFCRMLRHWKREHAPKNPEETPDPRFLEACHKLDYADYIFQIVFIDGYNNMEVTAIFYRDYQQEVKRIEQQIKESGFTG